MPSIATTEIEIGDRHRADLGDIAALAASIEAIGLLHPIVIRPDNTLVVGQRRLEAFKQLGRTKIPVNIARSFSDLSVLLRAEADENTCRKAFTPSEAVAIGAAIEAAYKPVAAAAQKESTSKAGKASASAKNGNVGKTFPHVEKPSKEKEADRTSAVAAAAVGMSRPTYEKAKEVIASGNAKAKAAMDKSGKVNGAHKQVKVARQAAEIAKEPPPLPSGPFRVIVVDPPWKYDNRESDTSHRAANPYPSMTVEQIKLLPIGSSLAESDCILWLWTTNAHIPHAFEIAAAWGFTYKTLLTWVKSSIGTGDWLRGQTEHCLLCVRGKPIVTLTNQATVIQGPLREHSRKPDEFYAFVESLCPGSKLEMFQRTPRVGWVGHGDEIG